jgi:hypothetical protein
VLHEFDKLIPSLSKDKSIIAAVCLNASTGIAIVLEIENAAGAIGSPHRRDRAMLESNPCSSDFFVVIRYRK